VVETFHSHPVTNWKHNRNGSEIGLSYRGQMASPASHPFPNSPGEAVPQASSANRLLAVLMARQGRVVTRTELARATGLRADQTRRVDAMLIEVRRELAGQGLELRNVRSRGWIVSSVNS
jgi:DNA-binding response OmpR family regulator